MVGSLVLWSSTHNSFFPKINSHRGYELCIKLSICVLVQERCLADTRIAQSQKLDQIVIVGSGAALAHLAHLLVLLARCCCLDADTSQANYFNHVIGCRASFQSSFPSDFQHDNAQVRPNLRLLFFDVTATEYLLAQVRV